MNRTCVEVMMTHIIVEIISQLLILTSMYIMAQCLMRWEETQPSLLTTREIERHVDRGSAECGGDESEFEISGCGDASGNTLGSMDRLDCMDDDGDGDVSIAAKDQQSGIAKLAQIGATTDHSIMERDRVDMLTTISRCSIVIGSPPPPLDGIVTLIRMWKNALKLQQLVDGDDTRVLATMSKQHRIGTSPPILPMAITRMHGRFALRKVSHSLIWPLIRMEKQSSPLPSISFPWPVLEELDFKSVNSLQVVARSKRASIPYMQWKNVQLRTQFFTPSLLPLSMPVVASTIAYSSNINPPPLHTLKLLRPVIAAQDAFGNDFPRESLQVLAKAISIDSDTPHHSSPIGILQSLSRIRHLTFPTTLQSSARCASASLFLHRRSSISHMSPMLKYHSSMNRPQVLESRCRYSLTMIGRAQIHSRLPSYLYIQPRVKSSLSKCDIPLVKICSDMSQMQQRTWLSPSGSTSILHAMFRMKDQIDAYREGVSHLGSIQSAIRGYVARKRYKERIQQCVITIQSAIRGHLACLDFGVKQMLRTLENDTHVAETNIQREMRRTLNLDDRKTVAQLLQQTHSPSTPREKRHTVQVSLSSSPSFSESSDILGGMLRDLLSGEPHYNSNSFRSLARNDADSPPSRPSMRAYVNNIIHQCIRNRELLLDLSGLDLSSLPLSLLDCTHVTGIDLSENQLSSIPSWFATAFPRLRELKLNDNNLFELPHCFGELNHLEVLNLADNKFEFFPDALLKLASHLRVLIMSGNTLTNVPGNIERLMALQHMNLSSNFLMSLPVSMSRMTMLRSLNIEDNPFLQSELGNVTNILGIVNGRTSSMIDNDTLRYQFSPHTSPVNQSRHHLSVSDDSIMDELTEMHTFRDSNFGISPDRRREFLDDYTDATFDDYTDIAYWDSDDTDEDEGEERVCLDSPATSDYVSSPILESIRHDYDIVIDDEGVESSNEENDVLPQHPLENVDVHPTEQLAEYSVTHQIKKDTSEESQLTDDGDASKEFISLQDSTTSQLKEDQSAEIQRTDDDDDATKEPIPLRSIAVPIPSHRNQQLEHASQSISSLKTQVRRMSTSLASTSPSVSSSKLMSISLGKINKNNSWGITITDATPVTPEPGSSLHTSLTLSWFDEESSSSTISTPFIKTVLDDPALLDALRKFCARERSSENLEFWIAVNEFRKEEDPFKRRKYAQSLCSEYIDRSGGNALNIDDTLARKIRKRLQDTSVIVPPTIFDRVVQDIETMISLDTCVRFKTSDLYRDVMLLKDKKQNRRSQPRSRDSASIAARTLALEESNDEGVIASQHVAVSVKEQHQRSGSTSSDISFQQDSEGPKMKKANVPTQSKMRPGSHRLEKKAKDRAKRKISDRVRVLMEILESERKYVSYLNVLHDVYIVPLVQGKIVTTPRKHQQNPLATPRTARSRQPPQSQHVIPPDLARRIFPPDLDSIMRFNMSLLNQLEQRYSTYTHSDNPSAIYHCKVGDIFGKMIPFIKVCSHCTESICCHVKITVLLTPPNDLNRSMFPLSVYMISVLQRSRRHVSNIQRLISGLRT